MEPKVSIIITAYNREKYLARAITSCLEQTFSDFELLILDDGSTDGTAKIAREFTKEDERIKLFSHEKNLGIAKNRNFGLQEANGKYIAVLDSDDFWLDKNKLQKQVEFLENPSNSNCALVGTFALFISSDNDQEHKINFEIEDNKIRENILWRNQFAHSTVLYRKEAAFSVGGYNEDFKVAEDFDLWLKLGERYQFANFPEYAVGYQIHSGRISSIKKMLMARTLHRIIISHRKSYPNFFLAILKSYLRILIALI